MHQCPSAKFHFIPEIHFSTVSLQIHLSLPFPTTHYILHIHIIITILMIFLPVFQDQFLAAVDSAIAVHHHHGGWEIKEAGGEHK